MALMGAGSLVLTQVSVHGSYFPDIFSGLLLCGLGIGLAFVTATVAALAGRRRARGRARLGPQQHRLADRHGARRRHRLDRCRLPLRGLPGRHKGANPLAALTEGYQSAFVACAVLAGIGLALALLLPGRPPNAAHELPEPVPAASARD